MVRKGPLGGLQAEPAGRRSQLDSTTASIASAGFYTGPWNAVPAWANTILLVAQLPQFGIVEVQFSDDQSNNYGHIWRAWVMGGVSHSILVRGANVRLVIRNPGVTTGGTTGTAMSPTIAKIYASSAVTIEKTPYLVNLLENATVTTTITFGIQYGPLSTVEWEASGSLRWWHVVVGAVTGTSPTVQIGLANSPDGTNLGEGEQLSGSLTATNSSNSLGPAREARVPYVRTRTVVGGTSPSFAGYYFIYHCFLMP